LVKVKICGLTNLEDAVASHEMGADLLGFIFVKRTPRFVEKENVKKISEFFHKGAKIPFLVGLFLDQEVEEVVDTLEYCGLDHVQLHGGEEPAYCEKLKELFRKIHKGNVRVIKTFKVDKGVIPISGFLMEDYKEADYFLFDTFRPDVPGGTGAVFNWNIIAGMKKEVTKPFFIAGGLTPKNVLEAARLVEPYGVDVVSGVESSKGKMDLVKLKEFINNAKRA